MVISKFTTLLYYSCKIKRVSAWLGVWNPSKCHQQWPMAKCQSQDGKPFEKELPLSLVSLASTLATFVFGGLQMCPRFPSNWHQLTIHDQLKRRHAYFVAWVMPLPVGYISRGGRGYIINVWQHTTCQLQKDLCYEPCREIAANRFSRVEQHNTYCFHNHVWPLVLRPPV